MRVAAFLLIASLSFAQENHKFFDKTAAFTLTGSAAVFTTDAVITCQNLRRPGGYEAWLPVHTCAGASAWMAGNLTSQVGAAYWLHRRGHHRLERFAEMFWASGSGIGIAYSLNHRKDALAVPVSKQDPPIIGAPCGGSCVP